MPFIYIVNWTEQLLTYWSVQFSTVTSLCTRLCTFQYFH